MLNIQGRQSNKCTKTNYVLLNLEGSATLWSENVDKKFTLVYELCVHVLVDSISLISLISSKVNICAFTCHYWPCICLCLPHNAENDENVVVVSYRVPYVRYLKDVL